MTSTTVTVVLICAGGGCELAAAFIAFLELRAMIRRVPELRQGGDQVLEVLATDRFSGVNSLLHDRVVRAVLEQFAASGRSRVAIAVLVPIGIVLGTVADVLGATK